jgi:hypothetical protein
MRSGCSLVGNPCSSAYALAFVTGLWPVWKERSWRKPLKSLGVLGSKGWIRAGICFCKQFGVVVVLMCSVLMTERSVMKAYIHRAVG